MKQNEKEGNAAGQSATNGEKTGHNEKGQDITGVNEIERTNIDKQETT